MLKYPYLAVAAWFSIIKQFFNLKTSKIYLFATVQTIYSCLPNILLPKSHSLASATSYCLFCDVKCHMTHPFPKFVTLYQHLCWWTTNTVQCTLYSTYDVLYSVQYLLSCFHLKGRCCKAFEGKNYENESLGHWHILNDPKTWPVKPLVTPQKPALWSLKTLVSPQKPAVWHLKPLVSLQKPAVWPLKPAVWPLKPWVTPQKPAVWPLKPLV